jgi:hypothetical protein
VHSRSRMLAVLASSALLVSAGSAIADAAPSHPITSGHTTITLRASTVKAVHSAGLNFNPIAPATLKHSVFRLPARGGTANRPEYTVHQAGGLEIVKGTTTVKITHIVINSKKSRATANVTGHGNIVALVFGDPQSGGGSPRMSELGGYPVSLSPAAIKALDKAFATTVFADHPRLGTGDVTVRWSN